MKKCALAVFTLLLLFGAACSSQTTLEVAAEAEPESIDVSAPPLANDVTESAEAADSAPADDATETTESAEAADSAPADDAAETAQAPPSAGSDDWCSVAHEVENSFNADAFDAFADPDSIEDLFTTSAALINQAVDIAPPAIASDVAALAEATTMMIGLLEQSDWDMLTVDFEAFEEVAVGIEQAGTNVESYNFNVCGIGQDPDPANVAFDDDLDVDFDELLDSDVARTVMADTLAGFGVESADAACVVELWSEFGLDDTAAMITAFQQCDVPLEAMLGG